MSKDDSIFSEPHLRKSHFEADANEERVAERQAATHSNLSEDEQIEHTVWDEPGLSPELAGPRSANDLTYSEWLDKRRSQFTVGRTWLLTVLIAFAAGPFAVLGAFQSSGESFFGILLMVIIGPLVEEIMKCAIPYWAIEKRPFYFISQAQIILCAAAGGLAFATIENLLYLNIYIPDPTPHIIAWRWTVCTALHVSCSLIVGVGLAKIWRDTWRHRTRPRLALGYEFLMMAVVVHGSYNGLMVLLEMADFQF